MATSPLACRHRRAAAPLVPVANAAVAVAWQSTPGVAHGNTARLPPAVKATSQLPLGLNALRPPAGRHAEVAPAAVLARAVVAPMTLTKYSGPVPTVRATNTFPTSSTLSAYGAPTVPNVK